MSAPLSILVRVKWSASAQAFTAQTMVPVKERREASCTWAAENAAKRAAAKHFDVEEDDITFVRACKPGTGITQVRDEWAAFEFALKGGETQTELFNQGGGREA